MHDLVARLQAGEVQALAKAITLVESSSTEDEAEAISLLEIISTQASTAFPSFVIGITGAPGVGKSSLIEAFGTAILQDRTCKLAVLTIDPSSPISGGSVLGDKTRMLRLSQHPRCYIRPSPSGQYLGGLARRTHEAILLCQSAGYTHILVETVGTGQADFLIRNLVEVLILLEMPAAGDQLQGMKRGILELTDFIGITKADGDQALPAQISREQLRASLKPIPGLNNEERVILTSSLTNLGIEALKNAVINYRNLLKQSNLYDQRMQSYLQAIALEEILMQVRLKMQAQETWRQELGELAHRVQQHRASLRTLATNIANRLTVMH